MTLLLIGSLFALLGVAVYERTLAVGATFDPKSTIPHLVVINGIKNGLVYINDPATVHGTRQIALAGFLAGWKKKIITIRPAASADTVALAAPGQAAY